MSARLASQVRRKQPESSAQGILRRKCACGQHTPGGGECEECRKKRLQRKATAPEIVHEAPPGQRFLDFSGVRAHTAGVQVQRAPMDGAPAGPERSRDNLSYVEATELLKCVKIMGEANRTYCREVVLGEKPILTPGENFGGWTFTQVNTDGSATSAYQSDVKIKFSPMDTKVNCKEIAFVQSVRVIDPDTKVNKDPTASAKERMTTSAWNIDRFEHRKFGWYGFNNDGSPSGNVTPGKSPSPLTPAEMTDRPGWNKKNTTFEFETCSICKDGTDVGKIYGCVTWGFDVDASHKLKSHYLMKWDSPSAEF